MRGERICTGTAPCLEDSTACAVPDVASLRDAGTDSADRGNRDRVFEKSKGKRSGSMRVGSDAIHVKGTTTVVRWNEILQVPGPWARKRHQKNAGDRCLIVHMEMQEYLCP